MREIAFEKEFDCSCGRKHKVSIDKIVVGSGAIEYVTVAVKKYGAKRAFVVADENTYKAAGEKVCDLLSRSNVKFSTYIFSENRIEPDERVVGEAVLRLDYDAEIIIGVGSGVINDICKIVANIRNLPYIIVATAPSMDGYASATSSMIVNDLKVSVPSKIADVIIGDTDVLKNAPQEMLKSGLGDMLAKYVSIAEWRISHLITGEFYCEFIADTVRGALKNCVDNAKKLLCRDEKAVEAVFEGLIVCGIAMSYANNSRPASGVEHYISHIYDMRSLAFNTPTALHGIQCAVGTLIACKVYEQIKTVPFDEKKATTFVNNFDKEKWFCELKSFIGAGAEPMIAAERVDLKYDKTTHLKRLEKILKNQDKIKDVIDKEIPSARRIETILDDIRSPKSPEEIGQSCLDLPKVFCATKDIRDKYVLSRLCWDLGLIDDVSFLLTEK